MPAYRHRDGSTVWVRCRGIAIRDSRGRPIGVLGAHNDLTKVMHAERELRRLNETLEQRVETRTAELEESYREKLRLLDRLQQAQKLESLAVLDGGIAHDFNDLLV